MFNLNSVIYYLFKNKIQANHNQSKEDFLSQHKYLNKLIIYTDTYNDSKQKISDEKYYIP